MIFACALWVSCILKEASVGFFQGEHSGVVPPSSIHEIICVWAQDAARGDLDSLSAGHLRSSAEFKQRCRKDELACLSA